MANLLYLSAERVTMGNVFDSSKSFIVKDNYQFSKPNPVYTKTLFAPSLKVYRENTNTWLITDPSAVNNTRRMTAPAEPISGPFIENYSLDGTLESINYINLLLLDKAPIKTGTFYFTVSSPTLGQRSFIGTVKKLTKYTHYNWQLATFIGYGYVEQSTPLGYGIEIPRNILYTGETVEGIGITYTYTPTSLNSFLRALTGNEEITASSIIPDPNTFLNKIPGYTQGFGLPGAITKEYFFIPPEFALRYIASHTDLSLNYGANYVAGQQHWAGSITESNRTITFDPIAYLNKYSDIRQSYGFDTYSATSHYITTGLSAGRTTANASTYNPLPAGLYDERVYATPSSANSLIWPTSPTLSGVGKGLTYKYNTTTYYVNNSANVTGNVVYLKVQ